jgi:hypothetical protein
MRRLAFVELMKREYCWLPPIRNGCKRSLRSSASHTIQVMNDRFVRTLDSLHNETRLWCEGNPSAIASC